jgi:SAM-dependent methyltransferase
VAEGSTAGTDRTRVQAEYARRYRTLWERHWWWRSREAYVLGWVDRLRREAPGGGLRILDVGCGDGLFFERLERFGRVEGVEPDASLVSDPRWRDRIRVAAVGEGALPEAAYDLVVMLDVLEHIADDRAALGEVRAALRPGGHLLLTVPALQALWSRHDEVNAHHRRYDRRGLARLLGAAGFEVRDVRYFFAWTVAPLLLRRWLSPAGGTGRRRLVADLAATVPPAPVNRLLTLVSRGDHALGRVVRWPLGSSLLALARVAGDR